MTTNPLDILRPTELRLVMDLVRDAGVDVSDWANYDGRHPAANPKYCYEWVFVAPDRIVVCLWFANIEIDAQARWIQKLNLWQIAKNHEYPNTRSVIARRARSLDEGLQKAFREKLSVRAIIVDGQQADLAARNDQSSKVERRLLDPEPWHVVSYDWTNGDCVLQRGLAAPKYIDQFDAVSASLQRELRLSKVYDRSSAVRRQVLDRASGRCEYCGAPGFETMAGSIYLETHHVIALCEGGIDAPSNVAALCPDHHRQAHYGLKRDAIQAELSAQLAGSTV
ncbi:HNH endonuclease [Lysobacter enzymogenes]|uniref:HNH endonuclease n=1 Tax=Lysobacter enzymogenes TaxID=69 RepID=UPI0008952436|nr:HNH endonuclease [Lysobacter enzymogenes]SDX53378.1 5-methylcytosine-specific restriction enzyme A/putative restriction endonuclease [Lysobacter enzymogenes]